MNTIAIASPSLKSLRPEPTVGLEDRLGVRVSAALTERSEQAPADISERLRFAREQALTKAREQRLGAKASASTSLVRLGRTLALQGPPAWLTGLASVFPIVMLAAGLLAIDDWYEHAQIRAAAEVDVALLADDLPVNAYSDPGFAEFLKMPQE